MASRTVGGSGSASSASPGRLFSANGGRFRARRTGCRPSRSWMRRARAGEACAGFRSASTAPALSPSSASAAKRPLRLQACHSSSQIGCLERAGGGDYQERRPPASARPGSAASPAWPCRPSANRRDRGAVAAAGRRRFAAALPAGVRGPGPGWRSSGAGNSGKKTRSSGSRGSSSLRQTTGMCDQRSASSWARSACTNG